MDDFKFRAWDKTLGRMYQWKDVIMDKDERQTWISLGYKENIAVTSFDNEQILMIATGLKDRNKSEIYQSDIMYDENSEEYAVVSIKEGCTWLEFETHVELAYERCGELEVVGSVYENKELLKRKK